MLISYHCLSEAEDSISSNNPEGEIFNLILPRVNYLSKAVPRQAMNDTIISVLFDNNNSLVSISYFDGLGRLKQNVNYIDFNSTDVIADFKEYGSHGKIKRDWLLTIGIADTTILGGTINEIIPLEDLGTTYNSVYQDDNCFYSQTFYDNTVMHRPIETRAAGDAWTNHVGKRMSYLLNDGTDSLRCINLYVNSNGQLVKDGVFESGELRVTKTIDEDNHTSFLFYNREDSLILSRSINDMEIADTYYVYDTYGNLCFVLPPEMSAKLSAYSNNTIPTNDVNISDLCYLYNYDHRNRCVAKKLPGCEPVYYVYDRNNLLVYSQDGNLRDQGKWTYNAYDNLGRLAYTAVVNDNRTREQLQASLMHTSPRVAFAGANGTVFGYTASRENITTNSILSVNYYDNYDFIINFANDSLAYRNMTGYDSKYTGLIAAQSAKGLLTGTATRVLGDTTMLVKSLYYDCHGNVIQSHENNALGGYEHDYYHLTFTGKPLAVRHEHSTGTAHHVDINTMTYDAMERLLTTTVTHDGEQVDVISNTYDDLGRLASQSCLNNQQTTTYSYNIRNWITQIYAGIDAHSFPVMKQSLHYADAVTGSTPCFNGNISAMDWNTLSHYAINRYCYSYDGMNRLTQAGHMVYSPNADFVFDIPECYSTSYSYDLNSNITSLTRHGKSEQYTSLGSVFYNYGLIDNLSITRDGNQLKKVTDQCDELTYAGAMDFKDGANEQVEYTWDANGNMTSDLNKGISEIKYNVFNLPEKITHNNGHITYITYAADGRKLRVTYKINPLIAIGDPVIHPGEPVDPIGPLSMLPANELNGNGGSVPIDLQPVSIERVIMTRDYCGAYSYRNGSIERIMMGNGFMQDSAYYVQVKDYQGNVRAVLDQNHNVVERNDYYPYGGLINASDTQLQPYKYSSKELDRENGLDLYDSQARWYDPMLPQTTTQDPLAEKYYSISPYTWCAGNPVNYTDNNGMYFEKDDYIIAAQRAGCAIGKIFYLNKTITEGQYLGEIEDANERINQLFMSVADFFCMAFDKKHKYKFELYDETEEEKKPETMCTNEENNEITLVIPKSINGSTFHEFDHGGQVARGEFDFTKDGPDKKYGASHEIEAYKRQYSYDGFIYVNGKNKVIEIHNMKDIDKGFLRKIYENGKRLYNFGKDRENK